MNDTPEIAKIFSPAKINFFFAVTGLRDDGFHDVVSINLPLNFGDEISIKLNDCGKDELICQNDYINPVNNSILTAIKLFKEESKIEDNFKVILKKEIPISAGFGGGSSNAGTILKTLNKIYNNVLNTSTIEKICTKIGADCRFFLNPKPCITTGIGDIYHEISNKFQNSLKQYKMFIIKPNFGINTSAAYKELRDNFQKLYISEQSANEKMGNLIEAVIRGDEKLPLYNTFYDMLSLRNNNFIKLKTSMDDIHSNVMLTGSGSGFFGICKSSRVLKYSKSVAKLIFGSDIFWREVSVL